jgi:hypothetical protein
VQASGGLQLDLHFPFFRDSGISAVEGSISLRRMSYRE